MAYTSTAIGAQSNVDLATAITAYNVAAAAKVTAVVALLGVPPNITDMSATGSIAVGPLQTYIVVAMFNYYA